MSSGYRDENERLVAEQAVLVYRSVIEAMQTAPHGQGMACMEDAVLQEGREHLRQILERAATAHAEAQKKGSAHTPAAAEGPSPFDTRQGKR